MFYLFFVSIIKTRSLWESVGAASVEVKADKGHNLVSLLSMMIPSPDWSVGVDRLNLCNANCTWRKTVVQDLYPWDAGDFYREKLAFWNRNYLWATVLVHLWVCNNIRQ